MKWKWLYISFVFMLATSFCKSPPVDFIAVNQIGYQTGESKIALLVNAKPDEFEVRRTDNNEVVFRGTSSRQKNPDKASGDAVSVIDFTSVTQKGSYFVQLKNSPRIRSQAFKIDENVFSTVTASVLQSYYFHRCGTEVDNGTEWSYEVCHMDDAPFYQNPELKADVTGGWHDAGDYNKFSVNTALSIGMLLYLYELNPRAFTDGQLEIPESKNGIPDLLDETAWALEWMLKMQRQDGAVYHKVSQKKWTGEYLPHKDPETRYLFDVSSTSTAAFAAVAALGARLYRHHDSDFAQTLADASLEAWKFLERNPRNLPRGGFKNPSDVRGGEYGDHDDTDERLWASIELYRLTNSDKYLDFFAANFRKLGSSIPPISWKNFHSLALSAFVDTDLQSQHANIHNRIRKQFVNQANVILGKHARNNYLNLIDPDEYYWGSNSVGLAYAFDLIQAYKLTDDENYRLAALDQLHYVLGRNPLNVSQVTNVGSRSVQKPYHQLSEMGNFDEPIPGMLVGGPNDHRHLNDKVISRYPSKNYEDRFKNYLVNEPAINYTASLAYVVGYFSLPKDVELSKN